MDDGIPDGSVVRVRNGDALGNIMRDAVGTISATAEGTTVTVLDVRDPFIDVLVSYPPGAKEHYTFDIEERRLAWSQHRHSVMFQTAATLLAECS